MAIRTLLRLLALALAIALLTPILWEVVALLPMLIGLGLLVLTFGYLVLPAGGGDLTRWQLRYHLHPEDDLDRLEGILDFLAEKTGHFVLEANAEGLFLELPEAFDRYVEAQLSRALPEVKLSKDVGDGQRPSRGSFFLCIGSLNSDILRWATEEENRQVRLHIHQGPYTTFIARPDGQRPPSRWMRIRLPRSFAQRLPVWDELSAGVRLSSLFPPTGDGAVYSSRSRLLRLAPPDDYLSDLEGRVLGPSTDGRPLTLGYDVPLFTIGAPHSFLTQQALGDLETGRTVVIISPHRRLLERIGQQAGAAPVTWLDPQNGHRSAHLAIIGAGEWPPITLPVETVVEHIQTFLADASNASAQGPGLDVDLPIVNAFTHSLIHTLATSTRHRGQALAFTDLWMVSRSTRALRTFLTEVQGIAGDSARQLLALLDDDGGYVQAVTILSAIRAALEPLGAGLLQTFCQEPFLDADQTLREPGLVLVPMTNADFPENDRLLSAMLDLTLRRVLATGDDLRLALHLHEPHLYRDNEGERWINTSRRDPRLSLLLDVQESERYVRRDGAHLVFRCSEPLASGLVNDWNLPASASDLVELPIGTVIARLPGLVVTLKVSDE